MKIQAYDTYSQIATGNRITSASKDPAGLAISEKLNSQIKGETQGVKNLESSNDLLQTADGALNNIQNDLGRVRELAVQASNGILTDADKSIIQQEISSIFEGIKSNAQNTEFNSMKLLDGSFSDMNLGAGSNGQGTTMSIENTSLESLGLDGFSVQGNFSIDTIDQAIEKVSEARSDLGAKSNGFESNIRNTNNSIINQTASRSSIQDTDIAKASMELNKQKALSTYQNMIQKMQMEQEENNIGFLI